MREQTRETELDLLRIIALFAVIMVYCAGMSVGTNVSVLDNRILTFITAIITWQVPVYVMISGRFFLDPDRPVNSQKLKSSILRLIIAFLFWDCVYQIFYIVSGAYSNLNWKGIINQAIIGPYHFWYLYMCIGLYAVTPFLRRIVKSKRLMEYFIFLFIIGEALYYYGASLPGIGNAVAEVFEKTNFHLALGFTGYYVLGYYLYQYKLPRKWEILLYVGGITCLIGTGALTVYRSVVEGVGGEWYVKYLMPNIVVEAAAIYTFCVKRVRNLRFSRRVSSCITKLSEYSFGVYLIHALLANLFGYCTNSLLGNISPLIWLPIATIVVFAISTVLVHLMRKIPYGKKIT